MTGDLAPDPTILPTADDVAEAFVFLALARKTTAAVVTVDGGNIEASLR